MTSSPDLRDVEYCADDVRLLLVDVRGERGPSLVPPHPVYDAPRQFDPLPPLRLAQLGGPILSRIVEGNLDGGKEKYI